MTQHDARASRLLLLLSNLLLPLAVLTFASGFFPYKPMIPGLALHSDDSIPAPFNRVVFMVVDALRSDFVYGHGTGFEFTQSLIRSGAGIPFTAHATPPTVTMPRLKAITTGSVPSFLDLILNFAESDTSSSLALQDTWLAQLRARPNGRLVFYGDDTWLKLFPGDFFNRHDGTSSFFVSDFTEVDHNVTRHVPRELANADWNGLIMHYLGMDHIGHKTGPQGPNMIPKQKEMDGIVEMIYTALEEEVHHKNTLFVLAGDHGMNAGGNHGGSGPGETEPALLFISPKLKDFAKTKVYESPTTPKDGTQFHFYSKLEQSDLVPTLATLLGLPISTNSLGVYIPEMMGWWSVADQARLLHQNAEQLKHIVESAYGKDDLTSAVKRYAHSTDCSGTFSGLDTLACKLATAVDNDIAKLYDFLYAVQDELSSTASSYNIPRMISGIGLAFVSLVIALIALWPTTITMTSVFFFLACTLYGIMMFASSYVEEEQHFWYWMTPAWIVVLAVRALTAAERSKLRVVYAGIVLVALHRLSISWNQTGQKHAGEPDIVHNYFPDNHIGMWLLVLATYISLGLDIPNSSIGDLLTWESSAALALPCVLSAVVFKLNFTQADAPELVKGLGEQLRYWSEPYSLVLQARVVFLSLFALVSIVVFLRWLAGNIGIRSVAFRLQPLLGIFLATQTRAPNIPLLLFMDIQARHLPILLPSSLESHPSTTRGFDVAVTTLLLAHTTYYCFGGSNSISTLDLSQAYNGVADYNILAVGILLFASNWSGPVWWAFTATTRLLRAGRPTIPEGGRRKRPDARPRGIQRNSHQTALLTYISTMTIFFSASLVAVMAACTALRTHLFIWTVFSPKYLYAMAWSIGWHLLMNGVVGTLLCFILS